ncbi:MAG TPA: glycosyltransferase family 39 protein [Micromonosporaceae bacterium]
MAVIALVRIDLPEMWQDELVSINVASRPGGRILALLTRVDAVHGAYYLFLHEWIRLFGDSPVSVRTPSALAMAGTAACVALIGSRVFDRWTGLLGGFVFALIPSSTRFAQETRSYAFVMLFATLATLLVLLALERPTLLRWTGYAACVTALAYVNTVALAIVVGHAAGLLLRPERGRRFVLLAKLVLAAVVGVLPAVPVINLGLHQARRQIAWISHGTPWSVWPQTFASSWLSWLVTALAVVAIVVYRRRAAFPAATALAPLVAIWVMSLGALNYFFSKYLLFLLPAWAVLAGAGLAGLASLAVPGATRVRLRAVVPLVGVAVLAVVAVPDQIAMRGALSHQDYLYPAAAPRQPMDYRGAAKIVAAGYQPGDGIVYQRKVWWYMHDVGVTYYLPDGVAPRDVFLGRSAAARNELYPTECGAPEMCFHDEPRLWIVVPYRTDDPVGQLPDRERKLLVPNYTQVLLRHPSGMTVALLRHR